MKFRFPLILFSLFFFVSSLFADGTSWWNTDYTTTEGTEFWVTFMQNYGSNQSDNDIKLQIYATARRDAKVEIYGFNEGSPIKIKEFQVTANTRSDNQTIETQYAYSKESGETTYKSIFIKADYPIALFAYNYLDGSQDATSIYPTKTNAYKISNNSNIESKSLCLKDYVIQTYNTDGVVTEFALIATENDSEITIDLKETSFNGYKNKTQDYKDTICADTTISLTLSKGQVYFYRSSSSRTKKSPENKNGLNLLDKYTSLTGTKLCSDKNIVVFQGGQHSEIPTNSGTNNHIWTQAMPSNLWGKTFMVPKTKNLIKDCIHLTACQQTTNIKIYNTSNNIVIDTTINAFHSIEYYLTDEYCHIHATKPIECYAFFPKQDIDEYDEQTIAPAMLPILPMEQGVRSLMYATFDNKSITDNFVTIVVSSEGKNSMVIRSSNGNSFKDNNIGDFKQIQGTNYYYTHVNLDNAFKSHLLQNSSADFIAHAYGFGISESSGKAESYAYAIGSNMLHPAHFLIDGQRIDHKAICVDKKIDLQSVINYDYSSFKWDVYRNDTILENFPTATSRTINDYQFPKEGNYEIQMIVGRNTPICNYTISDTIKATIKVSKTHNIQPSKADGTDIIICEDDRTDEVVTGKGEQHEGQNDPYSYKTSDFDPGSIHTFVDRLTTDDEAHCDSIVHIKVYIAPNEKVTQQHNTCLNQLPFTWKPTDHTGNDYSMQITDQEQEIKNAKSFPVTLTRMQLLETDHGCKREVTLKLTVYDVPRDTTDTIICDKQAPFKWKVHGKERTFTESGTYSDTVKIANDCDDIAVLNLTINESFNNKKHITICKGESFVWKEDPEYGYPGHASEWKDTTITTTGTYTRKYKTPEGCDDIRVLQVFVAPIDTTTLTKTICQSELPHTTWKTKDIYNEYKQEITLIGWDNQTHSKYTPPLDTIIYAKPNLKSRYDCDSIVRLHLVVHPTYKQDSVATICEGDYVEWEGKRRYGKSVSRTQEEGASYFGTTKYIDDSISVSYKTKNGNCDSIRTLKIIVKPREYNKETASGCEPFAYTFNGVEKTYLAGLKGDTIYRDTTRTTTADGCESIRLLELTVYKIYSFEDSPRVINNNQPFVWHQENHTSLSVGEYDFYDKKQTIHGCDSIYHIHVTVQATYSKPTIAQICENESYQWLGHHNDTILKDLTPATYYVVDAYKTIEGQDSTFTLQLTVNPTYEHTLPAAKACQNDEFYEWRRTDNNALIKNIPIPKDVKYPHTLTETAALKTINGCDSVLHLPLTVYPIYSISIDTIVCEQDLPFVWELNDHKGIHNKTYDTKDIPADSRGKVWNHTESYTLESIYGCDSIITLNLMVNPILYHTIKPVVCPTDLPYFYNDGKQQATQAGKYEFTTTSKLFGCDSVVTIELTVLDKIETPIYAFICDNKEPYTHPTKNNTLKNLTEPKTYYDTLKSVSGCDSVLILTLDVRKHSEKDSVVYICKGSPFYEPYLDKYVVGDSTYQKLLTNNAECDSIVTVHTYLKDTFNRTIDTIVCEQDLPFVWELNDHKGIHNKTYDTKDIPADSRGKVWNHTESYTLESIYGCDSIITLNLMVNPILYHTIKPVVCPTDLPYFYNDGKQQATQAGKYEFTTTSKLFGCDSVVTIELTVLDKIETPIYAFICDNKEPYTHPTKNNTLKNLTEPKTYYDTLKSVSGCDSVLILTLEVRKHSEKDSVVYICKGSPFYEPYLDKYVVGDSTYQKLLTNKADCDSIVTVHTHLGDTFNITINRTICETELPDTLYFTDRRGTERIIFTENPHKGTPLDTTITRQLLTSLPWTCDSIVSIHYVINPITYNVQHVTHCATAGEYYYGEHGKHSITTGEYYDTYNKKNIYGCDSILELHLTVLDSIYSRESLSICANDTVSWQNILYVGEQYTQWGKTYDASQYAAVKIVKTSIVLDTVSYQTSTIPSCDSLFYLRLNILDVSHTKISEHVCQNDKFFYNNLDNGIGGYMQTDVVGTFVRSDTIASTQNCDSIVELTLHVHPTYKFLQTDTICQDTINSNYTWVDEFGVPHTNVKISIDKAGDYIFGDTLHTAIYGCDSIFGIGIHVSPIYRFDSVYSICENERITWQGITYAGDSAIFSVGDIILTPGLYYDTLRYSTIEHCDSTYYLQLNVYPIFDTLVSVSVCGESDFVWEQNDLFGIYCDTLWCKTDIDTMFLTCDEAIQTQLYKDTVMRYSERMLRTIHGCDSMTHVWLTIKPSYLFVTDTTICANERLKYRGKVFRSHDTIYNEVLTSSIGCDSIYQLRMHVKPTYIMHRKRSLCDNQWLVFYNDNNDKVLSSKPHSGDIVWQPGDYIPDLDAEEYIDLAFLTAGDCDSIYRFHANVNKTYSFVNTAELCSNEKILLHDNTYVGADTLFDCGTKVMPYDTIFTDTLKTINNCDSIYLLSAHILPQYHHTDIASICKNETYNWREQEFSNLNEGNYTFFDKYTTIYGCDSIYELRLKVLPSYFSLIEESICIDESYYFHGRELREAGFYYDSLLTINGCDSVFHLYLTVNDTTSEYITDSICYGESITIYGKTYDKSGHYNDTILNKWGCKHYVSIDLDVIEYTIPKLWADSICADNDAYELFLSYSGEKPIEFSLYYNDFGHSQGFEDIVHGTIDNVDTLLIPMPLRNNDRTQYPRPDHYPIELYVFNPYCQDSIKQHTSADIILNYPSWVTEQRFRDVIAILSTAYNGGYTFDTYQWYKNGEALIGETHEYLYLPQELIVDTAEYYVRLTRPGELESYQTCPITIFYDAIDTIAPALDYLSVVPTYVVSGHPVVNILSHGKNGTYKIYTIEGLYIQGGNFIAGEKNAFEVKLPGREGCYIFILHSDDSKYEPDRHIIVIVGP